jgi:hypothetical protein
LKDVKPDNLFDFTKEMKNNEKNFSAFVEDVKNLSKALPNNKYVKAIDKFYQSYGIETVRQMSHDVNWAGRTFNLLVQQLTKLNVHEQKKHRMRSIQAGNREN